MANLWKPMLAAKPEPEELDAVLAKLPYPALFSPKLDGIRATVQNGKLYSRALKLIPNLDMQAMWGLKEYNGLDGELVVGPPTAEDCFNRSTSVVMSRSRRAIDAKFYTFDSMGPDPFYIRTDFAEHRSIPSSGMIYVKHDLIEDAKQLAQYEAKMLKLGYEGVMRRSEDGLYKQGRSTLREGGLIAIKRFVDAEAVILDTYEQQENTNEKTVNELGKSKRSSHKAGKVGKGTLGGFTVTMVRTGYKLTAGQIAVVVGLGEANPDVFNIGTGVGLTDAVRKELWARRKKLPGRIVKLRYQLVGTVTKPRGPIFLGFRDGRDL